MNPQLAAAALDAARFNEPCARATNLTIAQAVADATGSTVTSVEHRSGADRMFSLRMKFAGGFYGVRVALSANGGLTDVIVSVEGFIDSVSMAHGVVSQSIPAVVKANALDLICQVQEMAVAA